MKVTLRPQVLKEVQYSSPFDYIKNEICKMVVYEKICFETYTNDQYISHKNNIAQIYFILGTAESTEVPARCPVNVISMFGITCK